MNNIEYVFSYSTTVDTEMHSEEYCLLWLISNSLVEIYQHFRGNNCPQVQGRMFGWFIQWGICDWHSFFPCWLSDLINSALKMVAVSYCRTRVNLYLITWCHIPEGTVLHSNCHVNFRWSIFTYFKILPTLQRNIHHNVVV